MPKRVFQTDFILKTSWNTLKTHAIIQYADEKRKSKVNGTGFGQFPDTPLSPQLIARFPPLNPTTTVEKFVAGMAPHLDPTVICVSCRSAPCAR